MEHDDSVYLGHMLEMAEKAAAKLVGKSRADFDRDEDLRIVLTHLIQNIGEAASRVSDITRSRSADSVAPRGGHAAPNRARLYEH